MGSAAEVGPDGPLLSRCGLDISPLLVDQARYFHTYKEDSIPSRTRESAGFATYGDETSDRT